MADKKHVLVFEKPWGVYNAGEKAGFSHKTARKLLSAAIAVPADENVATATVAGKSETKKLVKELKEEEKAAEEAEKPPVKKKRRKKLL